MKLGIRGLVAAGMTPMHADGSLDLERIPVLVDHYERDGLSGVYVCGSTGEGFSLSGRERRVVAERYVGAARGRMPVILQVGHDSVVEARELAEHAASIGADAISAMPPTYYKPSAVEVVVDCIAAVAEGAPDLPLYYYHIPVMSGIETDPVEVLRRGMERIPSLAGLKFTDPRVHAFQACVELAGDRLDLLYGEDGMLLSALLAGAHGAVGSTYNFAAPLYHRLIEAFERGDLERARRCQAHSAALVRRLRARGGRAAIKATMSLVGLDCGPTRLPLRALDDGEREALRAELEEIGFFVWARAGEPV